MLDHVSITVGDMARAAPFWDAVMAALGVPCVWRRADAVGYGIRNSTIEHGHSYLTLRVDPVAVPAHFEAPGRHWCFRAPSRAAVDRFYMAGLATAGTCNGLPGLRSVYHSTYYAAFLIDPDGNRIEAVCHHEV